MFATLVKELKLLLRDPIGFVLLLIMPGILIVVMAATQDSSYKDLQDIAFDVHIANLDKGKVGNDMVTAIGNSKKFNVINVSDTSKLLQQVNDGDIKIAAIIPENASAALVNVSNKVANAVANQSGIPASFNSNALLDSVSIALYFDPTLKPALKNGFRFALMQYVAQAKMEALMSRLTKLSGRDGSIDATLSQQMSNILSLKEYENAHFSANKMPLNSVQHNVPSWTIFAMFLIVVPISGNMLREREEGSRTRLRLIPGAMAKATIGTIVFYVMVCTVQFYLLMLIGIYLLPLFDLPKLTMGMQPWNALPLVLATAFAATSYGYFIGTAFKSPNQAMPIGAVSVVILAAIGGVWVPLEILPKAMTTVASFTPLYWSFNGINNLFVRGQGFISTLPYIGLLLGFGIILTLLCVMITKRRTSD